MNKYAKIFKGICRYTKQLAYSVILKTKLCQKVKKNPDGDKIWMRLKKNTTKYAKLCKNIQKKKGSKVYMTPLGQ